MKKKTLIIDFDTPIVRAAAVCQNNYMVRHKKTGAKKPFPSKKQFFAQYPLAKEEDFEFLEEPSLIIPEEEGFKIEWRAHKGVKDVVNRLSALPWVEDFKLVFGGSGNFRNEVATTEVYKGNRGTKPILTDYLKEYTAKMWPEHIVVRDGIEADDVLGHYGWQGYLKAKKAKDPHASDIVLVHIDKDINMVPGWHMHTDDKKHQVRWVSDTEAYKFFFFQLLCGDRAVDNIPGLKNNTPAICEKFGVRKSKTIGKKTAEKIIEQCESIEDAFRAVVFCYKECVGEEWKTYMQEQADLLWMQREPFPKPGSRFLVEEMWEKVNEGK